ncbi:class I adenylate-forming enzyme family protein [Arthrobacter sulfonylureivorans]|uniref:AMP-binding protein n=1 Tax=Arthrobacter sulfonylureivorans TaxID=2486855 RepID=A0ABY3W8Y0_9MICC|nr:AMP-binding protein [Arthrobacter sulfonylureivorans]UNK45680.1 AMP-binding protein [Arthrobacter sulfonylureivorans]
MTATAQHDRYTPEQVLALYRRHNGTLNDLVASRAETDPDRTMLIDRERTWTWAEGISCAARLASCLRRHGVGPGQRVALVAPNSGWHVLTLLASARLGAILVPLNPDLRGGELAYQLQKADPVVVLTAVELAGTVSAAMPEDSTATVRPLGEELLDAEPLTEDLGRPEAGAIIIFTSGTTGYPKGAVHSQRTLLLAGESFVSRVRLQPDDRCLTILPLFHINSMFYSVTGALTAGATLIIEPKFSASQFWSTVREHRVTQTNMIEAVGAILLKRADSTFTPDHTLRKIYGIRQTLSGAFRERFGVPHLVGGYGMTEIPGVLATPYDQPTPQGSMGALSPHPGNGAPLAECRIVNDGQNVPDGETGELWVRTPTTMLEYFRDPEQTAASFEGEWFRTGDLVRRDSDGWYYFVARKKDIIRCRGENISGAELDRVIASHPDVVVAAAIGVPSDLGDEDILVALTVREGAELTAAEITEYARRSLAEIKVPRYVYFAEQLPLTPTGKVAKHELKQDTSLVQAATDTRAAAAAAASPRNY